MLNKIAASALALTMLFGTGVLPAVNVLPDTAVTASAETDYIGELKTTIVYTNAAGAEYEVTTSITKVGSTTFEIDGAELDKAMDGNYEGLQYYFKFSAEALSDEYESCVVGFSAYDERINFNPGYGHFIPSYGNGFSGFGGSNRLYREGSEFVGTSAKKISDVRKYKPEDMNQIDQIMLTYSANVIRADTHPSYYHDVFDDIDAKLTYSNASGKSVTFDGKCVMKDDIYRWDYEFDSDDIIAAIGDDLDGMQVSLDISAKALTDKYPELLMLEWSKCIPNELVEIYDKESGDYVISLAGTPIYSDSNSLYLDDSQFKNSFKGYTQVSASYSDRDGNIWTSDKYLFKYYATVSIDAREIVPKELYEDSKPDDSSSKPDSSSKGDSDSSSKAEDSSSSKPDDSSLTKPDDSSSKPDDKPTEEDFRYKELDDGTIEITKYIGEDTKVKIPSKIDGKSVSSIGIGAFYDRKSVTDITIPDSVKDINQAAFYKCTNLESITIPDSVTFIDDVAFTYCDKLKSITIPASVTRIGQYSIGYCEVDPDISFEVVEYPFPIYVGGKKYEDFDIYCYKDTAGERYAINNEFIYIGEKDGMLVYSTKEKSIDDVPDMPAMLLGDVNGDGKVDISDVSMLINHVNGVKALTADQNKRAEVNGDGKVDIQDAAAIINHINGVKNLY